MYKPSVEFSKLRVLIVENHSLMRRLLGEMLRGFDIHDMRFAKNVPSALDLVYGEPVDLIILDFFLGELDGADFAKQIRHDENCCNRKVPILLITGMPDHQKVMRALDSGINGMLAKPIAPKDLYKHIHALMAYPRPFVISKNYVGPMRERKKPAVSRHPGRIKVAAPRKSKRQRVRYNPALEDGILA